MVDPVAQQVQFWQWSPEGYRLQTIDSDGCYRGVPGLIFSPEIFSLDSLQRHLPAFTSSWQQRQWEFQSIEGEELSSDSLPFVPTVGLQPQVISPEHFIAWCPETKLEGGPFPLIGGGEAGTRNAIAMLLMSLGLVEAVKLMPGYEWVRLLRRVERQQQQDAHKRGQWWQQAQLVAQQLHAQYQVGGIGVIGALTHPQPLNYWSKIELVLWDAPEKFDLWRCLRTWPNQLPVNFIEARHATPAQWEDICQRMTVLIGEWRELERRQHQRLQFCWL